MRNLTILALAVSLLMLPATAEAAKRSSVLAGDGTLYSIHSGAYGDLFPEGSAAPAQRPVLALDVKAYDEPTQRLLVDGSADEATDSDVVLVFEDSSDTLFLLWQKSSDGEDSTLVLSSLSREEWSDPIALSGSGANLPGSSSLAVTRDSFEVLVEGEPTVRDRTVLHAVWNSGDSSEDAEPHYTAVILEDGAFGGYNPVVGLGDLVEDLPPGSGGSLAEPVLTIEPGTDRRAVVVTFTEPDSGHLVTVEVRLMPMELSILARTISRQVIDDGRSLPPAAGLASLAGGVGSSIIDVGYRFHTSLRGYLAAEIETQILDLADQSSGPGVPLESIAGGVGSSIIDVGLRLFGSDGMHRDYLDGRLFTLAISEEGDIPLDRLHESPIAPHLIRLYVVSDLPSLESTAGAVTVATSESGERSVASWEGGDDTIRYRQSEGGTWLETQTLNLGEGLDRDGALQILRDRVRKR